MHRQLRALTILDGLIGNAGARFQRTFADEPLLERLRIMPRDDLVDPDVRNKCNALYRQWAVQYKKTPGLEKIASLYTQLPHSSRKLQPSQSRVIRETEQEARREAAQQSSPPKSSPPRGSPSKPAPPPPPSKPIALGQTSSSFWSGKSKDKKTRPLKFNLEKEKGALMETIAAASVASTNLINAIKLINRENQRVSENTECRNRFDQCKVLRRKILRYIQLVESEQFIGGLLSANDELVKALMAYEVMDKSIDDDSDSDVEYQIARARRLSGGKDAEQQAMMANLSLDAVATSSPPNRSGLSMTPPRSRSKQPEPEPEPQSESEPEPQSESEPEPEEEDDEDNPFADRNAVKTTAPHAHQGRMTW
jgi:hypothetical protein